MEDCIFCKIAAGELSADMVYSDERIVAFRDINPVAPTHILIIPRRHIPSNREVQPDDEPLLGGLFSIARQLAVQEEIDRDGYRMILNTGDHGGQVVYHLHLHLIGGQPMQHPMG
jgi:histidine triad (HIT) family protein